MDGRSERSLDAKLIMNDGLMRTSPSCELDKNGYAPEWQQNLLPGIDPDRIKADLAGKKGSELDKKFKAAHSSSALAVNSFAFFAGTGRTLPIPGFDELQFDGFEVLFPTGLNRTPPHLDAAAHNDAQLVAIESKCLEYFKPKVAEFADDYFNKIVDERRDGPWFAEMLRLREQPRAYQYLDAAQLIKHGFGVAWTAKLPATLLYVYWEPDDARRHNMFAEHRAEIAAFSQRVAGGRPSFASISYPELWSHWAATGDEVLREHVGVLRARYGGELGSYEGYSRVDGRKTDEGFWGDLD